MAKTRTSNLGFQLDVDQILAEAQHRWLKTAEIAKVLRNHDQFRIDIEAPTKPDSGSVFLFNRKVLRYFRKDGHSWRKARNGSTIKEGHEKLKVGNVNLLNCYYAYNEVYEYFQRRSYWILEQDLTHIVFVHYLEAKRNKTAPSPSRNINTVVSNPCIDFISPRSMPYAESGPPIEDNQPATSRFHSYPRESPLTGDNSDPSLDLALHSQACKNWNFGGTRFMCGEMMVGLTSSQEAFGNSTSGELAYQQEPSSSAHVMWQNSFEDCVPMDQDPTSNLPNDHGGDSFEEEPVRPNPNPATVTLLLFR